MGLSFAWEPLHISCNPRRKYLWTYLDWNSNHQSWMWVLFAVSGKVNVCWVTVAISEGVQSSSLRKSHMGSPRMDSSMHLISWAYLMVPPGVEKVHRLGLPSTVWLPITMYLYFIARLFTHTYITIIKISNWLYCEVDRSCTTGFLTLLKNTFKCFLR